MAKHEHPPVNRILWNRRPTGPADGGDIDEIVIHNATVHVEQMDGRCWWIGVHGPDDTYWSGNFVADSRGRMKFSQQDDDMPWDLEGSHDGKA